MTFFKIVMITLILSGCVSKTDYTSASGYKGILNSVKNDSSIYKNIRKSANFSSFLASNESRKIYMKKSYSSRSVQTRFGIKKLVIWTEVGHESLAIVRLLSTRFLRGGNSNDIYDFVTDILGQELNSNMDINILIHSFKEPGCIGYFDGKDMYKGFAAIHVNADIVDMSSVEEVVLHEFQHLVNFYQRDILNHKRFSISLNEFMSTSMEELYGFTNDTEIRAFLESKKSSLSSWRQGDPSEYGKVRVLAKYLKYRYNLKAILNSLIKSDYRNYYALLEALQKQGYKHNSLKPMLIDMKNSSALYLNNNPIF